MKSAEEKVHIHACMFQWIFGISNVCLWGMSIVAFQRAYIISAVIGVILGIIANVAITLAEALRLDRPDIVIGEWSSENIREQLVMEEIEDGEDDE